MRALTDVEYEILSVLYFVEPYSKILEEVAHPRAIVNDALKFLIKAKMVSPMKWEESKQEFERTFFYNSDNMNDYHYLATKDGLMAQHSN